MNPESLLDKAAKRVDAAEVFFIESETRDVVFESGKLKKAESKKITGIALRIIDNGRLGFSTSTDPTRMDDLIEGAIAVSKFGKTAGFTFPGQPDAPLIETFDPAIESYSFESAVSEGAKAVELLRGACPEGHTDVSISTAVSTTRIINTSGCDYTYRSTDFDHDIVMAIIEGDSILWISDGGSYGSLILRTDHYTDFISDIYAKSKLTAKRVSGKLPALFTARQIPELLESLEMGVDGRRRLKGESPLIGREGERVLGTVTITDDPLLPFLCGSRPVDDEGMVSRQNVLFDRGVFTGFLYDSEIAADSGTVSTGSADRDGLTSPSIGTSNIVMEPGDTTLDDMIASLDDGIVVFDVIGGGQSNLLAGDFSVNIMLGFHVINGEFAGRLVDTMVSGNVYDAFSHVGSLGKDIEPDGGYCVPDVLFTDLTTAGS